MNIATTLIKTIDAALNGKPASPPDPYALHKRLYSLSKSPEAAAITKRIAPFAVMDADWPQLWRAINILFTDRAAAEQCNALAKTDEFKQLSNQLQTREFEKLKWKVQDLQNDSRETMRKLMVEATKLANEMWAEFLTIAESALAEEEKIERARFEKFGLEWEPSALILALRDCVNGARNRVANAPDPKLAHGRGARPAEMVPFVNLETA